MTKPKSNIETSMSLFRLNLHKSFLFAPLVQSMSLKSKAESGSKEGNFCSSFNYSCKVEKTMERKKRFKHNLQRTVGRLLQV